MANNLILIGFMGVGKGTIARELARQSGLFAIDTDDLIESLENKKIKEIFKDEGEDYFRALEKKTAKWLEKSVKKSIISTGGGFYKVSNLNKIGTIIYLESRFEKIIERIQHHPQAEKKFAKRPLLQDLEQAKKLFLLRVKAYEACANLTITVEDKTPQQIAKDILKLI
ncbi:shikimate kinase [Sulfurospirillum sp. 1612]|uniref:shikimate kinase n=1 Tax=Sulfurospirillum sp. 1612 TaxID=3094835 RepID=UPI002F94DC47